MKVNPELEGRQVTHLREFRARRDSGAATRALDEVKRTAQGEANLMPAIVAAVKAKVTLGEIANGLRSVFGEHGR